jgi:hypothetical protein
MDRFGFNALAGSACSLGLGESEATNPFVSAGALLSSCTI